MTHQLIASPYPEGHVVVRPGYDGAVRIGADRYAELRDAPADAPAPDWLADPVRAGWGTDLAGRLIGETILIRPETAYGYARARWKPYLDDPETAAVFAGQVLTHSDWTPDNVLIAEHRAWLIDWAWPTLGAAWTDPACWVLRLMASGGHTAHEAERQASRLPAFQAADPAHIDLFAEANVRVWDEIAQSSTSDWTAKMAQAAKSWAAYRQAH